MATSPNSIAATRRTARPAIGAPTVGGGEPRTRLDACRQGATDADRRAAHEDARVLAERADDFARELGARGRVGRLFARRAAVMSLRLEQTETFIRAARAARMAEARAQFDRDRADELADLALALDQPGDPRPILDALAAAPEGVAYLIERWEEISAGLHAEGASAGDGGDPIARRWLALPDPTAPDRAALIAAVDAELDRLRRLADAPGAADRAVDAAREQAANLAAFDPSLEGERARRHEAAAERSMYRACRAIAEHRRTFEAESPAGLPLRHPAPTPNPRPPQPEPLRSPVATPASPALGSFPTATLPPLDAHLADLFDRRAGRDQTPSRRPNRPDLATLTASRR